jgi:hypothetical protein
MSNPYDDELGAVREFDQKTLLIRALNDDFRTNTGAVGVRIANNELVATRGVVSRGNDFLIAAVRAVAEFDDFNGQNDPHGEHDFGCFTLDGTPLMFMIGYYDETLTWGAEDPSDPKTCRRVLTIMLASEY